MKTINRKFGSFLQACLTASREEQLLAEIQRLAAAQIKGLGPAVANILIALKAADFNEYLSHDGIPGHLGRAQA